MGSDPRTGFFRYPPTYVALVFHFVFFSFFLLCFAFFCLSLNQLGEKVAELHAPALGPELMVFTQEYADYTSDYTGVKVEGLVKGVHQLYVAVGRVDHAGFDVQV